MIKFIVNKSNVNNISSNITHLVFDDYFNQIIDIPNSVTHLTFNDYFNQSIKIPNSITHLVFGYNFNQIVDIPNSVTHLVFGEKFNQAICIPNSVTHLVFGNYFNQKINIPNSITHLVFGEKFNQKINIPNSVTHLTIGHKFNIIDNIIPNSVTHLTFGYKFNKIIDIPNSVTHLTFNDSFNQKINIPNNVTHLTIGHNFDIVNNIIPNNIIHLTYNIEYDCYEELYDSYEGQYNLEYKKKLELRNKFVVEKVNHFIIHLDGQIMLDSEYIITNEMISKLYKNLAISVVVIDMIDIDNDILDKNISYGNFYTQYKNMLPYPFKKFLFLMPPIDIKKYIKDDLYIKYSLEKYIIYNCDEIEKYIIYHYDENLCKLRNRLVPIHSELITKVFNPIRLQKIADTYNIELVDLIDYY